MHRIVEQIRQRIGHEQCVGILERRIAVGKGGCRPIGAAVPVKDYGHVLPILQFPEKVRVHAGGTRLPEALPRIGMGIGNIDLPIGHGSALAPVGGDVFPVMPCDQQRIRVGSVILPARDTGDGATLQCDQLSVIHRVVNALLVDPTAVIGGHGKHLVDAEQERTGIARIQEHDRLVPDGVPGEYVSHQRIQPIRRHAQRVVAVVLRLRRLPDDGSCLLRRCIEINGVQRHGCADIVRVPGSPAPVQLECVQVGRRKITVRQIKQDILPLTGSDRLPGGNGTAGYLALSSRRIAQRGIPGDRCVHADRKHNDRPPIRPAIHDILRRAVPIQAVFHKRIVGNPERRAEMLALAPCTGQRQGSVPVEGRGTLRGLQVGAVPLAVEAVQMRRVCKMPRLRRRHRHGFFFRTHFRAFPLRYGLRSCRSGGSSRFPVCSRGGPRHIGIRATGSGKQQQAGKPRRQTAAHTVSDIHRYQFPFSISQRHLSDNPGYSGLRRGYLYREPARHAVSPPDTRRHH